MAADNDSEHWHTEMCSETKDRSLLLCDFLKRTSLPQCVCVTTGNYLSRTVQISSGDVLLLRSCHGGQVILSYKDAVSHLWTEVCVSPDFPLRFHVLPPKDSHASGTSRAVSMVTYPTISDLLLDCPTYFEATTAFSDPCSPTISMVKPGDRFRFVGLDKNPSDGSERLKVRDASDNIVFLSLDCRGNFFPLKDDVEYTMKELVELASVQRRLKLVTKDCGNPLDANKTLEITPQADSKDTYTAVHKQRHKSVDSSNATRPDALPEDFTGIVHLLKYESTMSVSPFNDLETVWHIPQSANLWVRPYYQDDYEVPAPKVLLPSSPHHHVPLPLNDDLPKFRAPGPPALPQAQIPVPISNFGDLYCSSFPVTAKIIGTTEADPFYQNLLKGVEEVIVYRIDEARRLYVKDIKNDDVYGLSHDLKLSFVEYPEKFETVSELQHLPLGTQVTVMEDVAADFPKPFSLRLGDILTVVSNVPQFVKMKHAHRDCQIIKCERTNAEGGENAKLQLPMELEVSMVMKTDSSRRKMISLQELLDGSVAIPNHSVASVPDSSEVLTYEELPVSLRILKSMKETYLVVASASAKQFPPKLIPKVFSQALPKGETGCWESQEPDFVTNLGLPVTSRVVLAFSGRLDLSDINVLESEADFIRLPIEKLTLAEFEERERMRKLNSDYEDIEFGSNSTLNDSGTTGDNISRASSTGVLDRKQKNTKMDKVRRFSRALNPKHWRHSKAEPEPLPHPSAMGLMALAARPKEDNSNDYHHTAGFDSELGKRRSLPKGATASSALTSESSGEEENFYEDVEIGPLKTSSLATNPARQVGAFSGPSYKSLPHRIPLSQPPRHPELKSQASDSSAYSVTTLSALELATPTSKSRSSHEIHAYDVPKPLSRAKNWAANVGNTIGDRLSMKPRYDVPRSSLGVEQGTSQNLPDSVEDKQDSKKPSSLLRRKSNQPISPPEQINDVGGPPIPPARNKARKSALIMTNTIKDQKDKTELLPQETISKSVNSTDTTSPVLVNSHTPQPKPRGLKKPVSLEKEPEDLQKPVSDLSDQSSSKRLSVKSTISTDTPESIKIHSQKTTALSKVPSDISSSDPAKNNQRPKPPPKPKVSIQTTV